MTGRSKPYPLPRTLEELVAWAHSQRATTRCAWCDASFDGTLAEGRAWHADHTDPKFTFAVYTQASKRRDRLAPAQRKAFDAAVEWAQMGTIDALKVPVPNDVEATWATENPA